MALLRQRAQSIQNFFDNQEFICQSLVSYGDEEILEKHVQIFPNPSIGVFFVKSKDLISKIEVFNLLGLKIYSAEVNTESLELDLGNQTKCVYLYQVHFKNGNSITGKLILQ